jgi:REP element-mobilizing transposase RayT
MPQTIGYHYVKSGFGLWLPGDDRGHWSEAWDEQIGFVEPHTLHLGDPVRRRMAMERMKHPPVRLSPPMISTVLAAIEACAAASPWRIAAASVEPTHLHLLITYSRLDIERTCKWLAQQMTKRVHELTAHRGPVFCEGYWCTYIFDESHWQNTIRYIERHNERRGELPRPYRFISA